MLNLRHSLSHITIYNVSLIFLVPVYQWYGTSRLILIRLTVNFFALCTLCNDSPMLTWYGWYGWRTDFPTCFMIRFNRWYCWHGWNWYGFRIGCLVAQSRLRILRGSISMYFNVSMIRFVCGHFDTVVYVVCLQCCTVVIAIAVVSSCVVLTLVFLLSLSFFSYSFEVLCSFCS